MKLAEKLSIGLWVALVATGIWCWFWRPEPQRLRPDYPQTLLTVQQTTGDLQDASRANNRKRNTRRSSSSVESLARSNRVTVTLP
jgi:hypothetical protein